nr:Chain B, Tyrosine-protein phosphatase non-receptor type 7 [synthetic construct]
RLQERRGSNVALMLDC